MEQDNGCRDGAIAGVVALLSGPLNLLLFGMLTEVKGNLPGVVHFLLPSISLILSLHLSDMQRAWRDIDKEPGEDVEYRKKYGRLAVNVAVIIFLLGGAITSIRAASFYTHLLLYGVVGFAWGMLWFKMLQKGYFNGGNTL